MRRPSLAQKRFGPGYRPVPVQTVRAPWEGCAAAGSDHPCRSPVYGSMELYVDQEAPPTGDWYVRLLKSLPASTWVRLRFCKQHLEDVVRRSEDYATSPDLWSPTQYAPPVLQHPPTLRA